MGKYMSFDEPEPFNNLEDRRSKSLKIREPFDAIGEIQWTYFVNKMFNSMNVS